MSGSKLSWVDLSEQHDSIYAFKDGKVGPTSPYWGAGNDYSPNTFLEQFAWRSGSVVAKPQLQWVPSFRDPERGAGQIMLSYLNTKKDWQYLPRLMMFPADYRVRDVRPFVRKDNLHSINVRSRSNASLFYRDGFQGAHGARIASNDKPELIPLVNGVMNHQIKGHNQFARMNLCHAFTGQDPIFGRPARRCKAPLASFQGYDEQSLDFHDGFDSNTIANYQVIDDGTVSGPSNWLYSSGSIRQQSNIRGPGNTGTYLIRRDAVHFDASIRVRVRNSDDDSGGVVLRFQDSNNHYVADLNEQSGYARIGKRVNGIFTELIATNINFDWGVYHELVFTAIGNRLVLRLDGQNLLSVNDGSIPAGRVGLFSKASDGFEFDDLTINAY